MDVAASEFFSSDDRTYDLNFKYADSEGSQKLSGRDLAALYTELFDHYPIVSIEVCSLLALKLIDFTGEGLSFSSLFLSLVLL